MKNLNTISYIVECVPYSSFPFFCLYIISVHSIVNLYSFKFIFSINFVADLSRVFYMTVSTAFHYIGDVFFFFSTWLHSDVCARYLSLDYFYFVIPLFTHYDKIHSW